MLLLYLPFLSLPSLSRSPSPPSPSYVHRTDVMIIQDSIYMFLQYYLNLDPSVQTLKYPFVPRNVLKLLVGELLEKCFVFVALVLVVLSCIFVGLCTTEN